MCDLIRYTKRIWAAVLASALILTSVPVDVFAETADEGYVEEVPAVGAEAASEDELLFEPASEDEVKSEPASEEEVPAEEPGTDELLNTGFEVCFYPRSGWTITVKDGITAAEEDKWYVNENATSITFNLTPPLGYSIGSVTAKIGEDDAVVTSSGSDYTVKRKDNTAINGNVYITLGQTQVYFTATVTDNTGDNATFSPGLYMAAKEEEPGKYSVPASKNFDEGTYQFIVSDVAKHCELKVTVNGEEVGIPDPDEDGEYEFWISNVLENQTIVVEAYRSCKVATLSLDAGTGITGLKMLAYKDKKAAIAGDILHEATLSARQPDFEFDKGNFLIVRDIKGSLNEETDFIRLTTKTGEVIGKYYGRAVGSEQYVLGTVEDDFILTAGNRKLSKDKLKVTATVPDDDAFSVSGGFEQEFLDGDYVKPGFEAKVDFTVTPFETKNSYRITSDGLLSTGSYERTIPVNISGGKFFSSLGFDDLAAAAFSDGDLNIEVGVENAGYQKQKIEIKKGLNDHNHAKATVDGETVEYSGGWMIPYEKDAVITIVPDTGYMISRIRYTPAIFVDELPKDAEGRPDPDALEQWLNKRNNKYVTTIEPYDKYAEFEIKGVDEPLYMYIDVDETSDYTLAFNGSTVLENGEEWEETVNYNEGYSIVVNNGATPEVIGNPDDWTITATVPDVDAEGDPVVVTDKVFGVIDHSATSITFKGDDDAVRGTSVTVNIKDEYESAEWTLVLDVNDAITTEDICFDETNKGTELWLGETWNLNVKRKEGFDLGRVKLVAEGDQKEHLRVDDTHLEEGWIVVGTTIEDSAHITKTTTLKFVDAVDNAKVVDQFGITIRKELVKNISEDRLKKFTATTTNNTITVNFDGILTSSEKALDSLYYLVSVKTDADPAPTQLETQIDNVLVPVTKGSYTFDLAKTPESFEAGTFPYTVSVKLVQTVPDPDGSYNPDNNAVISTDTGKNDVETKAGGVFATKLTFTKNKDKNLAKIYSTMEDVVLGTVSFPDVAKNKPVTVRKIRKVEVTDKSGTVLFSTENDAHSKVISFRQSDLAVIFDPHEASKVISGDYWDDFTGNYNVVTYAVEPQGYDVSVTYALKVEQGITGLDVIAPASVYRPAGKAATVKATVDYYPVSKPLPLKKVTWSLTEDEDGLIPFERDGITIKNGVVSIKNTADTDGLKFFICAAAADYPGHEGLRKTTPVVVKPQAEQPVYLYIGGKEIYSDKKYYSREVKGELKVYDRDMNPIDATFTVSGLKAEKDRNNMICRVIADRIVKKASITATATDGSKSKTSFEFEIQSDWELTLDLTDFSGDSIIKAVEGDQYNFTAVNDYSSDKPMALWVSGSDHGIMDHSIKFGPGIKKVSSGVLSDKGSYYNIVPTAAVGTVTITDNTEKPKTVTTITITNNKITASKTAAPRISASNLYDSGYDLKKGKAVTKDNKGNIFNYLNYASNTEYLMAGYYNNVTYTLTDSKRNPWTGKVMISTKDDVLIDILEDQYDEVGYGEFVTDLADGRFEIKYVKQEGKFYIDPGNYSIVITPVDNDLNATAKAATFKFKAAPAPKAKVSPGKTLFTNFESSQEFGAFKLSNTVCYGDNPNASFTGEIRGINTGGTINKFATEFEVLAPSGTLACIHAPADPADYDGQKTANGMSGYVEYSWMNLDGTVSRTFVKVTARPKRGGVITEIQPDP